MARAAYLIVALLLASSAWAQEVRPGIGVDARGGAVHTQTIEGFWSLIKRGVMGSYHKVSKKYLPLYVAEFQFRYNNLKNADIFGTAIGGC